MGVHGENDDMNVGKDQSNNRSKAVVNTKQTND